MNRVLVSACLLGEAVRFDGAHKQSTHPVLERWRAEGLVVPICPEVAGGLPVPRPPAELQADGRVRTESGLDVTQQFELGAQRAVELARKEGVVIAVLKARSPSCGSAEVYDGQFSGRLVPGAGLTTKALRAAGIEVFSEDQFDEADSHLRQRRELQNPAG